MSIAIINHAKLYHIVSPVFDSQLKNYCLVQKDQSTIGKMTQQCRCRIMDGDSILNVH